MHCSDDFKPAECKDSYVPAVPSKMIGYMDDDNPPAENQYQLPIYNEMVRVFIVCFREFGFKNQQQMTVFIFILLDVQRV